MFRLTPVEIRGKKFRVTPENEYVLATVLGRTYPDLL